MENKLIIEINQIKSNMGLSVITENTQILLEAPPSTAALETIFNNLFSRTSTSILKTLLTLEEQELIKKFIQGEIKDNVTKFKFSELMKLKGATTIQELKSGVIRAYNQGTINNGQAYAFNKILKQMEKTKTTWSKPLPFQNTIKGKVVKITDVLTSYFKNYTTINNKILSDLESYKYLRDKASTMSASPEKGKVINETIKYLDRIELNLSILSRKRKEYLQSMITQLKDEINSLPKTSAKRKELEKVITKMESPDATVESIWKYLPSSYQPEGNWIDEIKRLKKERGERLQGAFNNQIPGWMVSKKVDYKPSLREGATNWFTLLTGGIFPMLRKIAGNPKHLIRILGTETGARLFCYPFLLLCQLPE